MFHAERKISVRGLGEEVIVVVHQTVGMADPVVALVDVLEGVQEFNAVVVVLEDGLSLVSAGSDVVHSAGVFNS
jgi:hypothetical protein